MLGLQSQVICSAQDTFEARDEVEALIRKAWWRGSGKPMNARWMQDFFILLWLSTHELSQCSGAEHAQRVGRSETVLEGEHSYEGEGDGKAANRFFAEVAKTATVRKHSWESEVSSQVLRVLRVAQTLSDGQRGLVNPMLMAPGSKTISRIYKKS